MRASKFTEQQIVAALRQAEDGAPVVERYRKFSITEQTYSRWTRKFAGTGIPELRRLRQVASVTVERQARSGLRWPRVASRFTMHVVTVAHSDPSPN